MENGMPEVGTGEVTDRIIAFFEERAQHNIAMIILSLEALFKNIIIKTIGIIRV